MAELDVASITPSDETATDLLMVIRGEDQSGFALVPMDRVKQPTSAPQFVANAAASAEAAEKWAELGEDVEVASGKFSAKHYALKAEASAARVDLGALDGAVAAAELAAAHAVGLTGRGLRAAFDAAVPLSLIPDVVAIQKLRSTYMEFAVYSPLEPRGINWARMLHTDRLLPGNAGVPELLYVTKSQLYASTTMSRPAANTATGIVAATPTVTQNTAAATARTGTWTASTTVGGVTDIRYSTIVGNKVTYVVDVPANGRIVWRTYASTNGGIAHAAISLAGVPLASDKWLIATDRKMDLALVTAGLLEQPLAHNMPAGSYTVEIDLDAATVATRRLYDGGMKAFAAIAFDAVGIHGRGDAETPGGNACTVARLPGTTMVMKFETCSRIRGVLLGAVGAGKVEATLFSATNTQIAQQVIDAYSATVAARAFTAASNQIEGDFYLHLRSIPDKNAAATGYAMYAMNGYAVDESTAGVAGVDPFDDLDMEQSLSNAALPGTHVLLGPANIWSAFDWKDITADWPVPGPGIDPYVSGVHRNETALAWADLTFGLDGAPLNMIAKADLSVTVGRRLSLAYQSTLNYAYSATTFGTLYRKFVFGRGSVIASEVKLTLSRVSDVRDYFALMLQFPNGGDDRSDGVGGGFADFAVERDGNYYLGTSIQTNYTINQLSEAAAAWNDQYAVVSTLTNLAEIEAQFGPYGIGIECVLLVDRTSRQSKIYVRPLGYKAEGFELPSGFVGRVCRYTRIIETPDGDLLGAA